MSSVRVKDRGQSKFETADMALNLATHTFNILANPNIFNPIYQKNIDEIAYEARMIYHNVRVANEIMIKDILEDEEKAARRLEMQEEALRFCEDLRTDIMIAKGLFHLRAGKVRHWNTLLKRTEDLIKNWNKADKKRYSPKG